MGTLLALVAALLMLGVAPSGAAESQTFSRDYVVGAAGPVCVGNLLHVLSPGSGDDVPDVGGVCMRNETLGGALSETHVDLSAQDTTAGHVAAGYRIHKAGHPGVTGTFCDEASGIAMVPNTTFIDVEVLLGTEASAVCGTTDVATSGTITATVYSP